MAKAKQRYKHHCPFCKFLGNIEHGGKLLDIYEGSEKVHGFTVE